MNVFNCHEKEDAIVYTQTFLEYLTGRIMLFSSAFWSIRTLVNTLLNRFLFIKYIAVDETALS